MVASFFRYLQKILFILVAGGYLAPAPVHAQISFRLNVGAQDQLDSFGRIICNDEGDSYCVFHQIPKNDSISDYHSSVLFKISPSGDTNVLRINKLDTTLYYDVAGFDQNGNILLGGESYSVDSTGNQYGKFQFFLKVTENLEIIWERKFHLETDSMFLWNNEIAEIQNGRILSVSTIQDLNSLELFMTAFVLSANGDSLQYHTFDSEQYGLISTILYDSSSNRIGLHMEQGPPSGGYSQVKRMELDTNLNLIAIEAYPDDYFKGPFNTKQYNNNSLLSCGHYYNSSIGKDFINVRIMDESLSLINEMILCDGERETYPAWDSPVDFYYINRIFVSGMYDYMGLCPDEPNWIYIACLNDNLEMLYEEYWGGDAHYNVRSTAATPDGGVLLSGFYYDHQSYSYQYDGFVIKFDSTFFVGIESPAVSENSQSSFIVRANRREVIVDSYESKADLALFDLNGRCVLKTHICSGSNSISTKLNSGIYIWRIVCGTEYYSGKTFIN